MKLFGSSMARIIQVDSRPASPRMVGAASCPLKLKTIFPNDVVQAFLRRMEIAVAERSKILTITA
jgi:hypothetical protein